MKKMTIIFMSGGIRGVLPGVILAYIEEQLQEKSKDTKALLRDCFYSLAETSTGGILTCMYVSLRENGVPPVNLT